jgi:hypothetical protein
MTDRDIKKAKETARPKGLVSSTHQRSSEPDPFDDDGLDELLLKSVGDVTEPRLVLRERLLNGTRTRREV